MTLQFQQIRSLHTLPDSTLVLCNPGYRKTKGD